MEENKKTLLKTAFFLSNIYLVIPENDCVYWSIMGSVVLAHNMLKCTTGYETLLRLRKKEKDRKTPQEEPLPVLFLSSLFISDPIVLVCVYVLVFLRRRWEI